MIGRQGLDFTFDSSNDALMMTRMCAVARLLINNKNSTKMIRTCEEDGKSQAMIFAFLLLFGVCVHRLTPLLRTKSSASPGI